MKPWVHLDSADVPGGSTSLRLMQRDTEFSIILGPNELMNSRLSGSEEALATLAATALASRPAPRVLIGGLGMGFTLRAALGAFPADASLQVAELVPKVIAWARGPLQPVFGTCLEEPRVTIVNDDVAAIIAAETAAFDAILLDVDNGPDGVSRAENDRIYGAKGLGQAFAALRSGGVLAVWSAHPSEAFSRRLGQTRFLVDEHRVRARPGKGARHVIWIARKPG